MDDFARRRRVLALGTMSYSIFEFVKMLCEHRPTVLFLLVLGLSLFILLVTDAHKVSKSRNDERVSRY